MLSNTRGIKTSIRSYVIANRWYRSSNQMNRASLYSRISPMGDPNLNVTPELEKWVEMGNKVRFAEVQRIVMDLRKRKRFSQALQVSEWIRNKGFVFTPVQHAVQLDLIGKVHGFQSAENYFNSLSEEDKTHKVYGAMLHCYVRQLQTGRALMHFNTMEEKGVALSVVAYNGIMSLYSNTGKHDKVLVIFNQMKERGVQPDNLSYRICINSYGVRSDIEGLEKILNEMESDAHIDMDWNTYAVVANFLAKASLKNKACSILTKAEGRLNGKDGLGYNHLISIHARLGNKEDVLRLWSLEKERCNRCLNRDYITMLESLVKLDALEEAEKVLREWESSGNCYDFSVPSVVILGHIERGSLENGEALLKQLIETNKASTPYIWCRLAIGYLEKDVMGNSLESLKVAVSLCDANKGIKLGYTMITKLLSLVGEKGRFEYAEQVVNLLRPVMPMKKNMYQRLLTSYVVAGGGEDRYRILNMLKADNYENDKDLLRVLSLEEKEHN